MADDDKNYTVDDILAEYDHDDPEEETADSSLETPEKEVPLHEEKEMEETALNEAETMDTSQSELEKSDASVQETEEYDNYEDGEEQDLSEKNFAQDPLFRPAELFDSGDPEPSDEEESDSEETDGEEIDGEETDSEEIDGEDIDRTDTEEEIFADENGDDEDEAEIAEELLEETGPETDNEEAGPEIEPEEDEAPEEPGEARTWAENGVPEEITDIDVPEEPEADGESEKGESSEDKPEEKTEDTPEEAAAPETSEEPEDVNDKFLVRFAKGIFPVKGDSIGEVIRKIIFLAALIVFIGAGVMLASTLIQSRAAQKEKKKAGEIITTTVASYTDEYGNVVEVAPTEEEKAQHRFDVAEYYKNINPDYVGYLEVEGCEIYEPVVQGEDNDYYLKTNLSGGYNKAGTVFMDYRCTFAQDYESPNIVLYGHNQEDGTMFGNLKWYKQDVEFYKEHPVVKLSSEFETGEYLIYGFFVTHVYEKQDSNGEVFHYHDYIETLNDEYTFNWYIKEVQRRNQIVSPVDVEFGDKLLCLSTCSNEFTDSRFVVFARKLREGETADDYDFSKAYMNPNAEGLDWEAIMSGETTPAPETDVIENIEDEAPEVFTRDKTNSKKNSGSGSKSSGEPSIVPPPAETAAPSETKKKDTETTTTTAVTESSETEETGSDASETEPEADGSGTGEPEDSTGTDSSETEAPEQEGEQTETAQS